MGVVEGRLILKPSIVCTRLRSTSGAILGLRSLRFWLAECLALRWPPPAFLYFTWPLRVIVTRFASPLCDLCPCMVVALLVG